MNIYFTQQQLSKVTEYPSGVTNDRSLLYKYWISPMCARIVAALPSYVAPNLLTLTGWFCTTVSFFLSAYYMNDMTSEAPSWVYILMGVLIFTYMTLDNMDGKQAFRTGSSTPLGEALDHGVDSFSVGIIIAATASVTQAGDWWPIIALGPAMVAFYLAHWQEYFNHFLELGLLGPTEAEVLSAGAFIATGIFGPWIWTMNINILGFTVRPNQLVMLATTGAAVYTIITSLYDGLTLANKKGVNITTALVQLIPFTLSLVLGGLWVYTSYDLYERHTYLMIATFNLLFSYLTILCIVQRICQLSFSYFYVPMLPLIFASINSVLGTPFFSDQSTLLYVLAIFYTINCFLFCNEVVSTFCQALKIKFLSIAYPNKATKTAN